MTFLTMRIMLAGRSKLISDGPGIANRCRAIACGRVNSCSPSAPWMRPMPDSPTPPNGSAGIARRIAALTEGQAWPDRPQGRAVFTGRAGDTAALAPALRSYGLETIEFL